MQKTAEAEKRQLKQLWAVGYNFMRSIYNLKHKHCLIFTISFLFVSSFLKAQTSQKESEQIAIFCKIWGFLKYYHPEVTKGNLDWDKEFTTHVRNISSINSKEEQSKYYSNWITGLGRVPDCKKCLTKIPDSLKFNLDLNWINDKSLFSNELIKQLQHIIQNRNQEKNHYIQQNKFVGNTTYDNEKPYRDSIYPSAELRLLGLSRYWNIINYFFPYKNKIGTNWDSVLIEMVPKFMDSKDTTAYHLAMLEIVTKINDSHAHFVTKYTNRYFGFKWAPFEFKLIDNKAIVIGFYDDSLCEKNDIQYGDVFLKVNDISIENIIKEKSKYISASNEPTRLRNMHYAIFNGQTDSVKVTIERNNIISEKYIYRYYFRKFKPKQKIVQKDSIFKVINNNIGYVDMATLKKDQIKDLVQKLQNTKAIIFDVRNYPNGTMYSIADFLNSEVKPFAKFTKPDISYPGIYNYTPPYTCGRNNPNNYKGKVILLFNEESQSHAEFTLMALQTAPNVVSIGSQTAGADGNVSSFTFPGGYQTSMSGIGVFYPDGRETQRIGIVPNIEVKPTIEGIRAKKDELMLKALEVINGK